MIIKRQKDRVSKPINHPGPLIHKQVYIENGQIPGITQIATVVLKPNDHISAHTHADMYECFVVLNGTLTAIINTKVTELKKHDFVCVEPREQHELVNLSPKNTMLLYWSFRS